MDTNATNVYIDWESTAGSSSTGTDFSTYTGGITGYRVVRGRFDTIIGEHEQEDFNRHLEKWFGPSKPQSHQPHRFKFIKIQRKKIAPTEELAPLFEMEEIEGRHCAVKHLRKLLYDVAYRKEQMENINRINKAIKANEVQFDVKKIKNELKRIIRSRHRQKKLIKKLEKIQARAEILLKDVCTVEQMKQYTEEKRIEIIARNGKLYEILASGKVNQLLKDGKKKGLCVVMRGGSYPIADIIVAKKLMLEAEPDEFDRIAIPCSPFR